MNHANTNRKRLLATVAPAAVLLGLWAGWGSVSRWIEQRASELAPPTPTLGSDIALQNRLIGALRSAAGDRGKAGDWTGAIRLVDQVCTPRQCPPALRELRAEAYLRTGDKPRAQSDFKELLGGRIPPDPNRMSRMPGMALIDTGAADPIAKGLFLALVGDTVGYAAHRTDVSRRTVGNTLSALDANNTAWACAYLPGDPADFKIALGLARSAVDRAEPDSKPTYLNTLGVLQVRAGRHADALRSLNEAEKLETEPANWPFLALAHDALGHPDDARRWADKLDRHLRVTFGRDTSNRRELLLFHGEIQRLLAGGAGKKNP